MIYKIRITEEITHEVKDLLMKLQKDHKENLPGISELYDELCMLGRCESYSLERIYYVAYTLATTEIDFLVFD